MSAAELSFCISNARIHVRCALPEVHAAITQVWGAARAPLVEITEEHRLEVELDAASGARVLLDGVVVAHVHERSDALAQTEAVLYAAFGSWLPPHHLLLHAACVVAGAYIVVLLGPSGAGKSSFALAAIERGHRYLADELTLTDGRELWGVPRAVQLEPRALDAVLPARLASLDRRSYLLTLANGTRGSVPLRVLLPHELVGASQPVERACVVRLRRDPEATQPQLAPLPVLSVLAELHEAAFAPPRIDLGALVGTERGYALLERTLSARQSIAPPGLPGA